MFCCEPEGAGLYCPVFILTRYPTPVLFEPGAPWRPVRVSGVGSYRTVVMQNARVVMKSTRVVMKSAVVFCVVAIMAGGITACGQKGPLYLPQQQSKPQPDAKPASSAPASAPTPVAPGTDPS